MLVRRREPQISSVTSTARPTYTIALKDFISLSEYTAGFTKPPAQVPKRVVDTIDRAISVRMEHAAHLAAEKSSTVKNQASDKSHSYFVGVLERVRDILRPRMPNETMKDPLTKPPSIPEPADPAYRLANTFAGLGAQEPSETILESPVIEPDMKPEPDYRAEQLQDAEEAYLGLHLLLQDFSKLRTVISQTWAGYHNGKCDLVAASITTNTAIDFARQLEEDLQSTFEKYGGVSHMLQVYFLSQCEIYGEDPNYREQPGDDMNFRMYDVADELMWPTHQFLDAFSELVDRDHIPSYKPGFYGTYNPYSDRATKTPREKFLEDKIVLLEILPQFAVLCVGTDTVPAEDELIRGLRVLLNTHELSLSTVFAAQVFLDIHHMLRQDIVRGLYDLQQTARHIEASITSNLEFHRSLRIENWPRSNVMVLQDILARINDWVKTDPIQEASRILRRPAGEPFQLMKNHPVFCGL